MPDQEATMRQMVQNHARMCPRLLSDIDHLSESSKKAHPKPRARRGNEGVSAMDEAEIAPPGGQNDKRRELAIASNGSPLREEKPAEL